MTKMERDSLPIRGQEGNSHSAGGFSFRSRLAQIMMLINHEQVIGGLQQLRSEAEQRRLWLSDGDEVSSFVEAYCELFVDSCLTDALDSGETEFGAEVDRMLGDLNAVLMEVDNDRPAEKVIADPKMAKVKELASESLRLVMTKGSKNPSRITARILGWRDKERQRRLWLPAGKDAKPMSSPYDAYWHLFHGKDYWGYLDLGERKRELSEIFLELDNLVWTLDKSTLRPPEQVIADPMMPAIREMAGRIAGKLGID